MTGQQSYGRAKSNIHTFGLWSIDKRRQANGIEQQSRGKEEGIKGLFKAQIVASDWRELRSLNTPTKISNECVLSDIKIEK